MPQHTVAAFDEELTFLAHKIAEMGGHAERMVSGAVHALIHSDTEEAQRIVTSDLYLDECQRAIDDKAVEIIARRQPMASDLREIIAAIRISADLERVGDLSKNTAKRVLAAADAGTNIRLARGIEHLNELALGQLKDVLDAFGTRTVDRLKLIRDRDDEIDAMYTSLFRELLTYMMEDPRKITACTHLLFCAKNIERIGDHATNIAESVYYMVSGDTMPTYRPKDDTSHRIVANPPEVDDE